MSIINMPNKRILEHLYFASLTNKMSIIASAIALSHTDDKEDKLNAYKTIAETIIRIQKFKTNYSFLPLDGLDILNGFNVVCPISVKNCLDKEHGSVIVLDDNFLNHDKKTSINYHDLNKAIMNYKTLLIQILFPNVFIKDRANASIKRTVIIPKGLYQLTWQNYYENFDSEMASCMLNTNLSSMKDIVETLTCSYTDIYLESNDVLENIIIK